MFFIWWNFGYHVSFSRTFLSHNGISAIMEPSRELFFHIMEFRLSRSLVTNFFIWWNFGYHGAFHELFFHTMEFWLSQSLLTNFYFHMMEFRLSRSLSWTFLSREGISTITEPFTNFSFTRWNFGYNIALSWNFSFTLRNFGYHGALSWNNSPHLEILKTYESGGNSFHKW
jgi:hypothetical protein